LIEVTLAARSSTNQADVGSPALVQQPDELVQAPAQAIESGLVDRLLKDGLPRLRFPAELEARFHQDCAEQRLTVLLVNGVMVAILFNWLLWTDYFMVPDVFDLSLRLRLFVFTPLTIACLIILAWVPFLWLREWSAFLWGTLAAGITLYVCAQSHDAMAAPNLLSLLPIVMFANTMARMRFVQAVMLDGLTLLVFLYGWYATPPAPLALMLPALLTLLACMAMTLFGCYQHERQERLNWLRLTREKFLYKDLERASQHLETVSRIDMLTEVSNRRHFDEFLQQVWDRARLDGSEISVMMIDLDHFKAYNERYGQPQGDICLKDIAMELKRRLRRPGDLIARYGGEQFIAVLVGTPLATAVSAAERVRKGVEALNLVHAASNTQTVVTVSVGVACLRPNTPHSTPSQLIAAADEALYQAKSRGRNLVFAFGTDE
jgi:diguanylate cyclase (GGDEF)-like protein